MTQKVFPYTVIKDSREQDGYTFEKFTSQSTSCNGMIVKKLDTGDYTLLGMEDKLCVERKGSVTELAINLGKDKVRFLKEIERMEKFPHKFLILEFSLEDLMNFPDGTDIPEKQISSIRVTNKYILKMLTEFQIYNNIHVVFCENRKNSKLYINSLFKRINDHYTIGRKS